MSRFGSLFALCILSVAYPAHGEALRSIDMDSPGSKLLVSTDKSASQGPIIVDRPGAKPVTTTFDIGTKYHVWRTDDGYHSPHAIALRIDREIRSSGESAKSKIEINVARHDDNELDNATGQQFILRDGTVRFVGFAMRLDNNVYEAPRRWVLHFQVWQCCALGQPPLSLQASPQKDVGTGLQFSLIKRTDKDLIHAPSHANGEALGFLNGTNNLTLLRGQWYRFVFRLAPGTGPLSGISMWVNGEAALDHRGRWGYTPLRPSVATYAVKIGIYRAAQDAIQQISLDSIRWGLSREDVDPDNFGREKVRN